MPSTGYTRSIPTYCVACGRNLAQDETHVTGWDGREVSFYCAGHPCDPRQTVPGFRGQ